MKTFQEFYNFIQKLTPSEKSGEPYKSYELPNTTISIDVYRKPKQVNIMNAATNNLIVSVHFRPEHNEVDCFSPDLNGHVNYNKPFIVPMSIGIILAEGGLIASLGLQEYEVLKGVLEHIEEINKISLAHEEGMTIADYIYLLANPHELGSDTASYLVGHVLRVHHIEDNRTVFLADANTNMGLWTITPAEIVEETYKGFASTFLTIHGNRETFRLLRIDKEMYRIIELAINGPIYRKLLNGISAEGSSDTVVIDTLNVPDKKGQPPIILLNREVRQIPPRNSVHGFGNGYTETRFVFNREITEDEFLAFLKEDRYPLVKKGLGVRNYSQIVGTARIWKYFWVTVNNKLGQQQDILKG